MAYVPAKGDALMVPSGPSDHLFVVVTDASHSVVPSHLLLNFSSIKSFAFHDPTCIVAPGEHTFITIPSFVSYEHARIELVSDLSQRVDSGKYKHHPDAVSSVLLQKIRHGIMVSRHIAKKHQNYFAKQAGYDAKERILQTFRPRALDGYRVRYDGQVIAESVVLKLTTRIEVFRDGALITRCVGFELDLDELPEGLALIPI